MKKTMLTIGMFVAAVYAIACTAFIAGKNATVDGSMISARNEDLKGVNPKKFVIMKPAIHKRGEMFVNPDTGFKWPMPRKTLKYSILPDSDPSGGVFGEAGFNENGVSASTTVSANANDAILKHDPYVKGGITEPDMASLILMSAKDARDGIKIIANIIDKVGAGEGNILVVADKNEMWYMEIYTGHQYVAVKVPDDSYAVFPNAYYLGNYNFNDKDVIASKDIENLPKKHKLAKNGKNGKFHLALTYREENSPYNVVRIQQGQNYFTPSSPVKYDENATYELFRKPDKKISVEDVMNFLRYRYEGTEFDANIAKNKGKVRPIGDESTLESHVIQMRKDKLSVMWLSMGTAEHSVYVPFYENISKVPMTYRVDNNEYEPNSIYWAMKSLHIVARENRDFYTPGIRKHWSGMEKDFIAKQKEEDKKISQMSKKEAEQYANKIFAEKTSMVKKDADKMFSQLMKFAGNLTERKLIDNKERFEFKK
ncbi:C69 family dipeptidase [Oceanivirga salmonicida]|uniref:C69 family dipeptidase n=1 Tax=Oceanivirga salmonicida TaxID=1769291 RepID=UPI0009EC3193|nr:C69 family dipeptidase [Oceanivirga salmonicida]